MNSIPNTNSIKNICVTCKLYIHKNLSKGPFINYVTQEGGGGYRASVTVHTHFLKFHTLLRDRGGGGSGFIENEHFCVT